MTKLFNLRTDITVATPAIAKGTIETYNIAVLCHPIIVTGARDVVEEKPIWNENLILEKSLTSLQRRMLAGF